MIRPRRRYNQMGKKASLEKEAHSKQKEGNSGKLWRIIGHFCDIRKHFWKTKGQFQETKEHFWEIKGKFCKIREQV